MATQYVYAAAAPGRTLTTKLYDLSMTVLNTAVSTTEEVANSGIYLITFVEPSAYSGTFRIVVTDDVTGYGIATYQVVLTGTDAEKVQGAEFINTSGGDASEAKQDQIIAAISPITTVYTPQLTSETLDLIMGDAYDGQANQSLAWSVSKDITGETVNFSIRDSADNLILDTSTDGVTAVASGTTATVSLSSAATELLDFTQNVYYFDVEVEFSSTSRWTVAKGIVNVSGDVSR